MSSGRRKFTIPSFFGVFLFLLVIASTASGWMFRLEYIKGQAVELQDVVGSKQLDVIRGRAIADGSEVEAMLADQFLEWQDMVDDETLRVDALSRAAQEADVTIVSLRGLGAQQALLVDEDEDELDDLDEEEELEEPTVIAMAHEIEVAGGQQQLAQFLDGIYQSPGRMAIDDLIIVPGTEDQLRASMLVRWYGAAPPDEDEYDEEEEGEDG